jgi:tRNA-splicing ligase RtcB
MGTNSYIVEGLGNPESFCSASHGAGRRMGRKQFNETHTVEEADASMQGIVYGRWNVEERKGKKTVDISECPLAYKSIDEVMENEKDLVKPIVKLTPLAVMKG